MTTPGQHWSYLETYQFTLIVETTFVGNNGEGWILTQNQQHTYSFNAVRLDTASSFAASESFTGSFDADWTGGNGLDTRGVEGTQTYSRSSSGDRTYIDATYDPQAGVSGVVSQAETLNYLADGTSSDLSVVYTTEPQGDASLSNVWTDDLSETWSYMNTITSPITNGDVSASETFILDTSATRTTRDDNDLNELSTTSSGGVSTDFSLSDQTVTTDTEWVTLSLQGTTALLGGVSLTESTHSVFDQTTRSVDHDTTTTKEVLDTAAAGVTVDTSTTQTSTLDQTQTNTRNDTGDTTIDDGVVTFAGSTSTVDTVNSDYTSIYSNTATGSDNSSPDRTSSFTSSGSGSDTGTSQVTVSASGGLVILADGTRQVNSSDITTTQSGSGNTTWNSDQSTFTSGVITEANGYTQFSATGTSTDSGSGSYTSQSFGTVGTDSSGVSTRSGNSSHQAKTTGTKTSTSVTKSTSHNLVEPAAGVVFVAWGFGIF